MFFNAGCNSVVFFNAVFSPKPWKKLTQINLVVFEKNQTNGHFNSEK